MCSRLLLKFTCLLLAVDEYLQCLRPCHAAELTYSSGLTQKTTFGQGFRYVPIKSGNVVDSSDFDPFLKSKIVHDFLDRD
jgi:hypothetical protein